MDDRDDGAKSKQTEGIAIVKPNDLDVLMGRGRTHKDHIGNQHFQGLLSKYSDFYLNARAPLERYKITNLIVDEVLQSGRFLKPNGDKATWTALTKEGARLKVAHAFQYITRKSKTQEQAVAANSSSSSSCTVDQGPNTRLHDLPLHYHSNESDRHEYQPINALSPHPRRSLFDSPEAALLFRADQTSAYPSSAAANARIETDLHLQLLHPLNFAHHNGIASLQRANDYLVQDYMRPPRWNTNGEQPPSRHLPNTDIQSRLATSGRAVEHCVAPNGRVQYQFRTQSGRVGQDNHELSAPYGVSSDSLVGREQFTPATELQAIEINRLEIEQLNRLIALKYQATHNSTLLSVHKGEHSAAPARLPTASDAKIPRERLNDKRAPRRVTEAMGYDSSSTASADESEEATSPRLQKFKSLQQTNDTMMRQTQAGRLLTAVREDAHEFESQDQQWLLSNRTYMAEPTASFSQETRSKQMHDCSHADIVDVKGRQFASTDSTGEEPGEDEMACFEDEERLQKSQALAFGTPVSKNLRSETTKFCDEDVKGKMAINPVSPFDSFSLSPLGDPFDESPYKHLSIHALQDESAANELLGKSLHLELDRENTEILMLSRSSSFGMLDKPTTPISVGSIENHQLWDKFQADDKSSDGEAWLSMLDDG